MKEKYTFFETYIDPIVEILVRKPLRKLGWWTCYECKAFLSPRYKIYVLQWNLFRWNWDVCSECYIKLKKEHEERNNLKEQQAPQSNTPGTPTPPSTRVLKEGEAPKKGVIPNIKKG